MLSFDDPLEKRPQRILVAGVSGVGKTTFASRISEITGAPYTEIDGLFHGPDWTPRPEFVDDVRALVAERSWITEWQYRTARPILTERADLMVWLDLPFATVTFPRVVRRTVRRRRAGEVLWNGNIEPPLHTFFTDREHIVRWAISTRRNYRKRLPHVEHERPDLPIVRLRSPHQAERWLDGALRASTMRE